MRSTTLLAFTAALCATACSSSDQRAAPSGLGGAHTGGTATAGTGAGGSSSGGAPGGSCADCSGASAGQGGSGASQDSGAAPWLPATSDTSQLPFKLNVAGSGTARLTSVHVTDNRVELLLLGAAHRGVVYTSHDWVAAGYTLYDVISIAEDGADLAVTYLYCVGTDLQYAYTESFQHALDWEPMSGTCDVLMGAYDTQVDLPALSALPGGFNSGISISGAGVEVNPLGGDLELSGSSWELTPFATVDCTDCPGGPWLEVHSLLRAANRGCFGILYLYPEDPMRVDFTNAICLPDLSQPAQSYSATWSGMVPMGLAPGQARSAPARLRQFGWRPAVQPPAE